MKLHIWGLLFEFFSLNAGMVVVSVGESVRSYGPPYRSRHSLVFLCPHQMLDWHPKPTLQCNASHAALLTLISKFLSERRLPNIIEIWSQYTDSIEFSFQPRRTASFCRVTVKQSTSYFLTFFTSKRTPSYPKYLYQNDYKQGLGNVTAVNFLFFCTAVNIIFLTTLFLKLSSPSSQPRSFSEGFRGLWIS